MAPPNTNHNMSVFIEFIFTLTNCIRRFGCNPVMEIYKFSTNGPQPREVYTNTSNYHRIRRKSGSSTLTQTLTINVIVTPDTEGFYVAVRDRTSCIQVVQLRVYRHECAAKQEGLVIFPDSAAPIEGNMTVTTKCMPNSSPATNMTVLCDSSGFWTGSAECECDPGYIMLTDSDRNNYCERKWTNFSYVECNDCQSVQYHIPLIFNAPSEMLAMHLVIGLALEINDLFTGT